MTGRRGFTLLEVMIALVAAAIISSLAAVATGRLQAAGRSRGERSGMAAALRSVAGVLGAELRSLGGDSIAGADHQSLGPTSVTFRAHRGLFPYCRVGVDSIILSLDRIPEFRGRLPASGRDSLLLYLPGDSVTTIDAWLPVPLLAGPFVAVCPGGWPGSFFPTRLSVADLDRVPSAGIARGFEQLNARLYVSAGATHFGLEELSAGGVVQPVAGPLRPGDGLDLVGWNRLGGFPGSAAQVAGFDLVVRALGARELSVGPGLVPRAADSVAAGILLRNVR
jgi:prepilin-type N-terminal cleavage/methylation domain-containing protein